MLKLNDIYLTNIFVLQKKDPKLAELIQNSVSNNFYLDVVYSKDGSIVPRFFNGNAAHSLYNPIIEASRLIDPIDHDTCVFFCGIGAGFHIRQWLKISVFRPCIILESDLPTLRSLLEIYDLTDILQHDSVRIIANPDQKEIFKVITETWKPALEKAFKVVTLRSWENLHKNLVADISQSVSAALQIVSKDFSVQSHFGRLWMRNALRNLAIAEKHQGTFPKVDVNKTAIIVAAGPSLEISIQKIIQKRSSYIVFATDTSYGFLHAKGIIPDFFVSIDAQHVSISHIMIPLHPNMTIVLDAIAHPGIALKAIEYGCNVIIGCGGHPLLAYASKMSPLPYLFTSSGTVTGTALGIAQSLGFSKIELIGADFKYTDGKAYTRSTYLDVASFAHASRLFPPESFWTQLIFRTPVQRTKQNGSISYTNEILQFYSKEIHLNNCSKKWTKDDFISFPFNNFLQNVLASYSTFKYPQEINQEYFFTLLPFMAWFNHSHRINNPACSVHDAINLALELIAGYTIKI